MNAKRDTTLDIAKGLGILLVVLGHNWIVQNDPGLAFRVIFSFHMPLFFFLSGVLLTPDRELRTLAAQRADSLLKPYAVVVLSSGAVLMLQIHAFSPDYLIGAFYASGQSLLWTPLWFLPHLFLCQLLAQGLLKLPPLREKTGLAILILLLLLVGVPLLRLGHDWQAMRLELLPGEMRQVIGLPWNLDLLPLDTAFLLAGYFCTAAARQAGRFAWPLLLGAGLIFIALHFCYDATLDLDARRYDSLLISTAKAASGVAMLLGLSALLSRQRHVAASLAYLGQASLFVFMFHAVLQGRFTGHFQVRLPEHPYLGAWLGFAAGLAVPTLMFELCRRTDWLAPWLLPLRARPQRT